MRLWWVFSGLLAVAAVVLLPLRTVLAGLGLDRSGLSAQSVTGSVWRGEMAAARFKGGMLGDVTARLSAVPLLTGTARILIAGPGLRGAVLRRPGGGGVADVTGRLPMDGLGGLPVAALDMEGFSASFAGGVCGTAAGRLSAVPGGLLATQGSLSGTPRCEGRDLLLPLASASGLARLDVRIAADGSYRATLALDDVDEAARAGMLAMGFAATPRGVAMTTGGQL